MDQVKANIEKLKGKIGDCRTGGKGTVRRKKKNVTQSQSQDDIKFKSALKKLQVQPFPGIDEVNFFKDDKSVLHFEKPDVLFSYQNNTYVITGKGETKSIKDLLPDILFQLGPKQKDVLTEFMQQGAGLAEANKIQEEKNEDDEDIPELADANFEEVSKAD